MNINRCTLARNSLSVGFQNSQHRWARFVNLLCQYCRSFLLNSLRIHKLTHNWLVPSIEASIGFYSSTLRPKSSFPSYLQASITLRTILHWLIKLIAVLSWPHLNGLTFTWGTKFLFDPNSFPTDFKNDCLQILKLAEHEQLLKLVAQMKRTNLVFSYCWWHCCQQLDQGNWLLA